MLFKVLVTILACDFIFVIIAIPLIMRKVPRNVIYGFRIKATLQNDFVWYEANAYFGKLFIISSLVSALLIILLYFSDIVSMQYFVNASIAVLVIPSTIPVLLTFRYIKSIKSSEDINYDRDGR
jgi:uncharacterized membrane protein